MYVGLSLSFCISDIIAGRVPLVEVDKIITSTACETETDWNDVIRDYQEYYWYENPVEAERITRQLREERRIEQPRLAGGTRNNLANGHWLRDGQLIQL